MDKKNNSRSFVNTAPQQSSTLKQTTKNKTVLPTGNFSMGECDQKMKKFIEMIQLDQVQAE